MRARNTHIKGARVFDGTGSNPYERYLLVSGDRIIAKSRCGPRMDCADAETLDGTGLFLMPGMTEGHGHLSFDNMTATADLITPLPEEQTLTAARNARLLFDHGFTGIYGASKAKLRLAVAGPQRDRRGPRGRSSDPRRLARDLRDRRNG